MARRYYRCSRCGKVKPHTNKYFPRMSAVKLHGVCKVCTRKIVAGYRAKHPDRVRESNKRYYWENRDKRRAHCKKWYQRNLRAARRKNLEYHHRNRTRRLAAMLVYREANREKVNAQITAWRRAHPEQVRLLKKRAFHKRRALSAQAVGQFSPTDVRRVYERQGGLCHYCTDPLNGYYHVDHKVPLSRGGSNRPTNICCACISCNLEKGTMTAREYRRKRAA